MKIRNFDPTLDQIASDIKTAYRNLHPNQIEEAIKFNIVDRQVRYYMNPEEPNYHIDFREVLASSVGEQLLLWGLAYIKKSNNIKDLDGKIDDEIIEFLEEAMQLRNEYSEKDKPPNYDLKKEMLETVERMFAEWEKKWNKK